MATWRIIIRWLITLTRHVTCWWQCSRLARCHGSFLPLSQVTSLVWEFLRKPQTERPLKSRPCQHASSQNTDPACKKGIREPFHYCLKEILNSLGGGTPPWPYFTIQLYRPSDHRLSAKLVLTFADRGCRLIGAANPHGRIRGSLERSHSFK
jgi:hypothetical protein